MAILDQVMQMKKQGFGDSEIITALQEQGINPKAISDALDQSQIKNAVEQGTDNGDNNPPKSKPQQTNQHQ